MVTQSREVGGAGRLRIVRGRKWSLSCQIRGADGLLSAGSYEVTTDEEMIEGRSFVSFRRIATMILVPAAVRGSTMEVISIGSVDLADTQRIDASMPDD